MKTKQIVTAILLSLTTLVGAQDYCLTSPIGYGKSATGGGSANPTVVNTTSAFEKAISTSGSAVILVSGTLNFSSLYKCKVQNKTIIGLPGATLVNSATSSSITENNAGDITGILYLQEGSSNVIIRNLTFKGAGAYDCEGNDGFCIDAGTNIWVDHCDFQDGVDGNFDMKGATDNITVTWCKFHYEKAPTAAASWAKDGGTVDHRFSDLIGSGADDKPTNRRITFAYCWWANGCVERMPRSRHSQFHLLNCYWNSSDAKVCLGLGDCSAYVEGCYFTQAAKVIYKDYSDDDGGSNKLTFVNSYSDKALPSNVSTATTPSYTYTALSSVDAKAAVSNVTCGAGATLTVDEKGNISSACAGPTVTLTSATGTDAQSVAVDNAMITITYTLGGTATGATVSGLPAGVTSSVSGSTVTISGTPTATGTSTYTITTTQSAGTAATATGTITVAAAPTLTLTSGSAATSVVQGAIITPVIFTYGGGATSASVTGLPAGFSSKLDAKAKTLTIFGSSSEIITTTTYVVTTLGGGGTIKPMTGTITVTADPNAPTLSLTSGSLTQAVTPGVAITPIVITWGGGATDATVSALPAGLSSEKSGKTITISGSPTATASFTVTSVGGTQSAVRLNATITVGSVVTEDFEDEETTSSSNSESSVGLSTGTWKAYKSKISTDFNNTASGTKSYRLGYTNGYVITPSLTGKQTVTFYVRSKKSDANLKVYISTDGGASFSSTATLAVTVSSSFVEESLTLAEYSNVMLKIVNETSIGGGTNYDLAIDDITFTPALTATSVAETSAASFAKWSVTSSEVTVANVEARSISIYSVGGSLVNKVQGNTVAICGISNGMYIAVAQLADGSIATKKLIKR